MTANITDLLAQIQHYEKRITPGPWEAVGRPYNACVSPAGQIRNLARLGDPLDTEAWSNAEFIALSRSALPQLSEALRGVLDVLDDYTVPGKLHDPTGITGAELETLEQYIREAITDALGDDDE